MKTLVLPIAGKSSRFPNQRPKWLLTHPNGTLMLTEAIKGLPIYEFDNIVIIALNEHNHKYMFSQELIREFSNTFKDIPKKLRMVYLDKPTKSQPETVYEGCRIAGIKEGGIYVKDCDNYFKLSKKSNFDTNFVSVCNLGDFKSINGSNKSYVRLGNQNTITNIAEKQIISDKFCCGGYYFRNIEDFNIMYNKMKDFKEFYISHMIYAMILNGYNFFINNAVDYIDWGTLEDWKKFKSEYSTIFIDIDGVLLENRAKHFYPKWWVDDKPLRENINYINKLYDSGKHYIILTTCRNSDTHVEQYLEHKIGIKFHKIIGDLPHTKRILINDYSNTNSYPSAIAINVKRNKDLLKEYLNEKA